MDELAKGIKDVLFELKEMNKTLKRMEEVFIRLEDETLKTKGPKTILKG